MLQEAIEQEVLEYVQQFKEEKGTIYRDSVVQEVDSRAVTRLRAISLRDFSGTVIFEEEKTRLYYTIRVLQDYLKEGRVLSEGLRKLPPYLNSLINGTKEDLLRLYQQAKYKIVDQQKRKEGFNQQEWRDLLELIKLGHYNLAEQEKEEALMYFNNHADGEYYKSYSDLKPQFGDIDQRLTDRLMYMKPSARGLEPALCK